MQKIFFFEILLQTALIVCLFWTILKLTPKSVLLSLTILYSKDIVKRTKRLNINKRYKYDEEGNMISTKRRNSNGTKNEKYGTNNAEIGTVNDIFSTMTDGTDFDESTLDEVESSNCDR